MSEWAKRGSLLWRLVWQTALVLAVMAFVALFWIIGMLASHGEESTPRATFDDGAGCVYTVYGSPHGLIVWRTRESCEAIVLTGEPI